jgi:hypothetical protein
MNVYLDAADNDKLNKVLFALYEANFVFWKQMDEIYKYQRDEKIRKLKEIYFTEVSSREGSE